ncbi:uncharacterized protein PAE49_021517 isoform 2-T2 [Odontesthes bonariensis]|uniref:uncharacterized protein LOC142368799 isoform X2 n=1 Tax=Odontesthes bonariensis TaxID=219752 RepID=UPI003F586A89
MNQCGKMKLSLSVLLLGSLCAPSSWSASSDTFAVSQKPDVTVTEGQTATIDCCWTKEFISGRVKWMKNQTEIKEMTFRNNSQESQNSCSTLTLPKIKLEASGRYICSVTVDIPRLTTVEGSGTVITVTVRPDQNTTDQDLRSSLQFPVIIGLGVVVPVFLIALICFCAVRRNQAQEARVIYEVPHTDSEVAEMDKHSTSSSRGSSQWCQVPVYESFDYFEQVVTKGSD